MSNGNNYLNLPSNEALLGTRSAEQADNSLDDEDEEEECYTLVPRSSPIPRKRGLSLYDETVEYMKIRLTLPSRRVSFIDSQGGDLVEVKEFVAFDSDEEEDPIWEIEEARYRPAPHAPIYQVCPDFEVPTSTDLLHVVRKNKIELECISFLEDDPLTFTGLIRVLNICFNKAVFVRFTMDGWSTFFDYPAEYVEGSNDVETDQYSFKLSFCAPYTTHGSRIEFVLHYETPGGDYWANNGGKNYALVLHVSYMDDIVQGNGTGERKLKSILKPPGCRTEDVIEETLATDTAEEDSRSTETGPGVPKRAPIVPQIIHPMIAIENEDDRPSSPSKTDTDHQTEDSVPLSASTPPSEPPLSFPTVEQVELFKPITSQPLTSQPQSESPQAVDFTKPNWAVEDHEEGTRVRSYDTKSQAVVHKGSETTIKVSSESHIFFQTIPPLHDEYSHEKDQDVLEGESESVPSHIIQEQPVRIPSPHKDPNTGHALEMEPNDRSRQDGERYLRYTGAFSSYQSLASERPVEAYRCPPEEVSETDPEGELCAPSAAVMVSQPGGEELAGLDSCTSSPPSGYQLVHSEEDPSSDSPEEPVTLPYSAPVLHFLSDELATKFDELLVPSGHDMDPMESLLESPVASVEEASHVLQDEDTMEEFTTPPDTGPDVVVQSEGHTCSYVPVREVSEELGEECSCHAFDTTGIAPQDSVEKEEVVHWQAVELAMAQSGVSASDSVPQKLDGLDQEEMVHQQAEELTMPQSSISTSDSAPWRLEGLEQEEVVRQQAAQLAMPQSKISTNDSGLQNTGLEQEEMVHQQAAELASHLRHAYVASSVFLAFAFCLVLAFHDLYILPLVLLYLFFVRL